MSKRGITPHTEHVLEDKMKKNLALLIAASVCVIFATSLSATNADEVVMKMIDAHGGFDRWEKAEAVQFRHFLWVGDDPDIWESLETVEQGRRRAYQDWPRDEARVGFDGEKTWSTNWKRGNPPSFMVHLSYYFLNLPWLTQDEGVKLTLDENATLPGGDEKEYITVTMTFDAGVGDTPDDYYKIFIDPDTYQMKATEFVVTHAAVLDLFNVPADVKFLGPITHVYGDLGTFDGLVIPTTYTSYAPNGDVYGNHRVEDISFSVKFEESMAQIPEGAIIDTSDAKKRASAD